MTVGRVKNWGEFQHYKDRSPPWIKLHRALLDDFHFTSLPLASKALAPLVWLLAAESSDGSVNLDPDWLAWRLRISVEDVRAGLSPLIERGFLEVASSTLASCKQGAIPEREGEAEREGEKKPSAPKSKKAKEPEPTLAQWIASLEGDAVPADDPLFGWAEKQGIPAAWLAYAWAAFEDRYVEKPDKVQADWRSAFRNHVKRGWLDVWRHDQRTGGFVLTTAGEQWRRECET